MGYLSDKLLNTGYLGEIKWDMGYYDQTKWDIKEENHELFAHGLVLTRSSTAFKII